VTTNGKDTRIRAAKVVSLVDDTAVNAEIDAIAARDAQPDEDPARRAREGVVPLTAPARVWRRCREVVSDIRAHADDPEVTLRLGVDELMPLRLGSIVTLIGGTGRGKTSMGACLLLKHAEASGPALAMSLELLSEEWTARAIGSRREASWLDVLRGQISDEDMRSALPERLAILDRQHATISELEATLRDLKREYPDEAVLVALDYVQLVELEDSREEIRVRIGRVMKQIDRVARSHGVVVVALSQGSRMSSRELASGDKLGAETTDTGAESADLERWATATIAIGALGEPGDDGSRPAQISLGKGRMTGGDAVVDGRFDGRTGRWWLVGERRSAASVRAERKAAADSTKASQATHAVLGALTKATAPMSRRQLRELLGGRKQSVNDAVAALLTDLDSGVVECGKKVGGAFAVWLRELADRTGVVIHER
jgi:hypothetical protein